MPFLKPPQKLIIGYDWSPNGWKGDRAVTKHERQSQRFLSSSQLRFPIVLNQRGSATFECIGVFSSTHIVQTPVLFKLLCLSLVLECYRCMHLGVQSGESGVPVSQYHLVDACARFSGLRAPHQSPPKCSGPSTLPATWDLFLPFMKVRTALPQAGIGLLCPPPAPLPSPPVRVAPSPPQVCGVVSFDQRPEPTLFARRWERALVMTHRYQQRLKDLN